MTKSGRNIQGPIDKAVDSLESATNDALVNYADIKQAFLRVHPYLLNQIALGVCSAVKHRETDGRINIAGLKGLLEES